MKRIGIGFMMLALFFFTPLAAMGGLQLRSIMNDLNNRMKSIVDGINREDFKTIEENALVIAEHERPPMEERVKILGFLKGEAPEFRDIDESVHAKAKEMAGAARRRDLEGVIAKFSETQKACISCHTRFKPRIVNHFYNGEMK